jgi:hypothetical protein
MTDRSQWSAPLAREVAFWACTGLVVGSLCTALVPRPHHSEHRIQSRHAAPTASAQRTPQGRLPVEHPMRPGVSRQAASVGVNDATSPNSQQSSTLLSSVVPSALWAVTAAALVSVLRRWRSVPAWSSPAPAPSWVTCTTAAEDSDWPTASGVAEAEAKGAPPDPAAPTSTPAAEAPPAPPTPPPSQPKASKADLAALKAKLYSICATTSRGFGATDRDRVAVRRIVDDVVASGRGVPEPTQGLVRAAMYPGIVEVDGPILGTWQLLYTTARDVLVLEGNPLLQVQSIYQVFRANGNITNVIDLGPRPTSLLTGPVADSTLRQKVGTRGAARSAFRVGLTFDSVESRPVTLFGQRLDFPPLKVNLPKLPFLEARLGADSTDLDAIGYFDIMYLDTDLLIYTQGRGNTPNGLIILTKRPDLEGQL